MTRIEEIKKRLELATKGEWFVNEENPETSVRHYLNAELSTCLAETYCHQDTQFIAHSKADIEFLLEKVERYEAALTEVKSSLLKSGFKAGGNTKHDEDVALIIKALKGSK